MINVIFCDSETNNSLFAISDDDGSIFNYKQVEYFNCEIEAQEEANRLNMLVYYSYFGFCSCNGGV